MKVQIKPLRGKLRSISCDLLSTKIRHWKIDPFGLISVGVTGAAGTGVGRQSCSSRLPHSFSLSHFNFHAITDALGTDAYYCLAGTQNPT